jgi:hypothetical protein
MRAPGAGGSAAGCAACHTTQSWKTMPEFNHDSTSFPLTGAHRATSCDRCHRANGKLFYPTTARTCRECHENVHGNQFSSGAQAPDCGACHNTSKWKPAAFNHDTQSAFKLEGAHRNADCGKCHKPGPVAENASGIVYKPTPNQCSACHEDIHAGQFAAASCGQCHDAAKWKPSTFDHNTQSTYKLDGAHIKVRCTLCHTLIKEVAGKPVLFYKPTPRQCADCHKIAGNKP